MSLNYVTLTGTIPNGAGATAIFTPSSWETDASDKLLIPPAPIQVTLTSGGLLLGVQTGVLSVSLLATDNSHLTPSGWTWTIEILGVNGVPPVNFSFLLPFANGATQDISSLTAI